MRVYTVSSKRLFDANKFAYFFRYVLGVAKRRKDLDEAVLFGAFVHEFLDKISLPNYTEMRDPIVFDFHDRPTPWQNIVWVYYDWHVRGGQQNVVLSEFPFLIQANLLCIYAGLDPLFEDDVYFAGVIDALVWDGEHFTVKDYKTYRATRDYPRNPLYDMDQLGMYCVALELSMGIRASALVEKIQANYSNIRADGADERTTPLVVNESVKRVVNGSVKRNGKRTEKKANYKNNYVTTSEEDDGPAVPLSSPSKDMYSLSFPAGNGRYRKMRILREHYSFTPRELVATARDFVTYILSAEELINSPHIPYFATSKYSDLAEEYYDLALALRRGESIEPILQEQYVKYPTHEEVLRAIRTWTTRATLLDSRRCPVVASARRSLEAAQKLTEGGLIHG